MQRRSAPFVAGDWRTCAAILVGSLLLIGLSGCFDLGPGDTTFKSDASAFRSWLSSQPSIASVSRPVGSEDGDDGTHSMYVTAVASPESTASQLTQLNTSVVEHLQSSGAFAPWQVRVECGPYVFEVAPSGAPVNIINRLRADSRFVGGTVGAAATKQQLPSFEQYDSTAPSPLIGTIAATNVRGASILAAFQSVAAWTAAAYHRTALTSVRTSDNFWSVSSNDGQPPASLSTYQTVASEPGLVGANMAPASLTLRVTDLAAIREISNQLLPPPGGYAIVFALGTLTVPASAISDPHLPQYVAVSQTAGISKMDMRGPSTHALYVLNGDVNFDVTATGSAAATAFLSAFESAVGPSQAQVAITNTHWLLAAGSVSALQPFLPTLTRFDDASTIRSFAWASPGACQVTLVMRGFSIALVDRAIDFFHSFALAPDENCEFSVVDGGSFVFNVINPATTINPMSLARVTGAPNPIKDPRVRAAIVYWNSLA
jgi:hypothetical protein